LSTSRELKFFLVKENTDRYIILEFEKFLDFWIWDKNLERIEEEERNGKI